MIAVAHTDPLQAPSGNATRWIAPCDTLMVPAIFVVIASPHLMAGWASMLVNCAAIFLALKHWVWRSVQREPSNATTGERIAFYTLWPGFDVPAFLDRASSNRIVPTSSDWLAAAAKTTLAGCLLWMFFPLLDGVDPLLIGLAGMLCGVLLIHCGLFHFVSLAWQSAGRPITPIMNGPLAATSLADFWSRRWNLAFRDAAAIVLFRPLARRFNPHTATIVTFFLSGLWHEAVISLPARGGYGLPTLYFLLQGAGMAIQRRWLRGEVCTRQAIASRTIAAMTIVLPLPLLFHRPFAERVIVPFLEVLGAI